MDGPWRWGSVGAGFVTQSTGLVTLPAAAALPVWRMRTRGFVFDINLLKFESIMTSSPMTHRSCAAPRRIIAGLNRWLAPAALLGACAFLPARATSVTAFDFTSPRLVGGPTITLGFDFTVNSDLKVTDVGWF